MGGNKRKWIWLVIGAVLCLIFPLFLTLPFPRHLMIMIFLYASLGLAWNMIGGYAGQISLGHAIFFGAGAYTSTLMLMKLGVSPWVGMLVGGILSVGIAFIIGYPCFKLAGHYFAIATIAIGEIAQQWMLNWDWAGSAVGLTLPILPESLINLEFHTTKAPYYYVAFGIFILAILATYGVDRSKLGYYFKAIKGDLEGARSLGINVSKYKFYALALERLLHLDLRVFLRPVCPFHRSRQRLSPDAFHYCLSRGHPGGRGHGLGPGDRCVHPHPHLRVYPHPVRRRRQRNGPDYLRVSDHGHLHLSTLRGHRDQQAV